MHEHGQATQPRHGPFAPGVVIANRYRVEKVLGAGGMGVVLSAHHLELDNLVAIKVLREEALPNPEAVARFTREARAAVKIKSEHIARVMDVATLPEGIPYMVMEYLEGQDLAALVRSRGALPVEEVIDFVLQACEAIAEAHSLRIVHRDLKPGNLFLSRRADGSELVKVLDFGISKIADAGMGVNAAMTATSALLGSPTYMSPEQLTSSRDVDVRADIWALGIILFELLTAQLPFMAETIPLLCIAILQTPLPSLRSLRPDVPPGLEAIVARCLEKDRSRRFANVGALAAALREFAPSRSLVSVERILRLTPGQPAAPSSAQPSSVDAAAPAGADVTRTFDLERQTQKTWGHTNRREKTSGPRSLGSKVALVGLVVALALASWVLVAARRRTAENTATKQVVVAAEPAPGRSQEPSTALPPSKEPTTAPAPGSDEVTRATEPTAPAESAGWVLKVDPNLSPPERPGALPPAVTPIRARPRMLPKPAPKPGASEQPAADSTNPRPTKPQSDWDNDRN